MISPSQQVLNSAQSNRAIKQISISKPKKIKHILQKEPSKPDWNDRFFLEKIPPYQPQKDRQNGIQKLPKYPILQQGLPTSQSGASLVNVPSNSNIVMEPGKIRKVQMNNLVGQPNIVKKRPQSHYKIKKELDENKYSNNPLVQHYINMQQKPIVYDLDQNPKIVEGYLEKLQNDVNIEWQQKDIPHFHRKAFSEAVKGLPKIEIVQHVYKELKFMKKDRAQIQICLKVIRARETCLETLKQQIELLKVPIDEQYEKNLQEISTTLKDLRILSLEVVEQILRWRESILNFHYTKQAALLENQKGSVTSIQSPKQQQKQFQNLNMQLPFYYNQRNYLLKMRDDIKFLKQSQLQHHVNLQANTISDPFLLTMQKQQNVIDPIYIDYPQITHDCSLLIQRIRASELIIFEESIQRRVKEQFGDYVVKPLNIQESQIVGFMNSYLDQIPIEIKNSFYSDVNHILSFNQTEQDVNFLKIESGGVTDSFQGLAIICVDRQQYHLRRTNILHVSCIEKSFYNSIINTLVDFIWKNDSSEEIRVNLFYQEEEGKLQLDPYVKNIFNNIGFKWKQLVNDPKTSKRSTIFGLRRPATIPVPKKFTNNIEETDEQYQQEPIQFNNLLILSEKTGGNNQQLQFQSYDIPIHLAKSIRQIKNKETQDQILSAAINQDTIIKAFGQEDFSIKGTLLEQFDVDQKLNEFCQQVFPKTNFTFQSQGQTIACISKNCYRWKHFNFAKYQNKNYIRIKKNEELQNIVKKCFSSADKNMSPLYFIPTDDEQVNFFLLQISEKELNALKSGEIEIANFVGNTIQKCDKDEVIEQDLWIPATNYAQNIHTLPKYKINSINQVLSKIQFSTDYKPQIEAGLIASEPTQQDSIVWQPPFIMGLVHNELSEKVDYPMISCLVEDKNIQGSA
ncbi:hypothetical protein TTHERM_00535760 (macronuclear) [Tetrahymena thermophila SB210]|uniref:Uncharacterized protein n=1 Tax=Tetrahymena thermophila (strain SB210) TaxID=312017 RepID=I7LX12_TETTS|nr:hypothetical protein TTHERM_00535760 [Tetrahymena thermophila SB210]EAS03240.2 hypothetical protein TTHERM_00535760 [Tetrahymena thermophila SB210]|eukprot:XP_001023485.2 hypothetical protein TTHERM_00535760 [Tetrahymena thermophila SB210]